MVTVTLSRETSASVFDASRRAVKELEATGLIYESEAPAARKMLTAAAMTYVAALATALLQLVRILLIRGDRR